MGTKHPTILEQTARILVQVDIPLRLTLVTKNPPTVKNQVMRIEPPHQRDIEKSFGRKRSQITRPGRGGQWKGGLVWVPCEFRSGSVGANFGPKFSEPKIQHFKNFQFVRPSPHKLKILEILNFWLRKFRSGIGPNGPRTDPERIPNGPRMDPKRPRTEIFRSQNFRYSVKPTPRSNLPLACNAERPFGRTADARGRLDLTPNID